MALAHFFLLCRETCYPKSLQLAKNGKREDEETCRTHLHLVSLVLLCRILALSTCPLFLVALLCKLPHPLSSESEMEPFVPADKMRSSYEQWVEKKNTVTRRKSTDDQTLCLLCLSPFSSREEDESRNKIFFFTHGESDGEDFILQADCAHHILSPLSSSSFYEKQREQSISCLFYPLTGLCRRRRRRREREREVGLVAIVISVPRSPVHRTSVLPLRVQ